jgi:hypothetical protein
MRLLDIIIILAILFIGYKIYCEISLKKEEYEKMKDLQESQENKKTEEFKGNCIKNKREENIYDSSMKYIDEILKSKGKNKNKINPYFMEAQFHNDYKDTLQAFLLLTPKQRQLFNRSNMPVINISTPKNDEILPLVLNFIKEVNITLDKDVSDSVIKDWKSNTIEKTIKSGWEKQQEKLGLPGTIYNSTIAKENINLIKIDHSERFETEDEIKYTAFLVIQKPSAKDQLLIKVSFHINKTDINSDRDLCKKDKNIDENNSETIVNIEEIFIMGFLTQHSFGKQSVKSEYYDFGGITDGRIFSQKQIMGELKKKRKQYEAECVFL